MFLFFEYLFYFAILALIAALLGFVWSLFRKSWKASKVALLLFMIGLVALAAPAIYTRFISIDLGPLDRVVEGERHLTLTGWDRDSYTVLMTKPDTVVLQMANEDVTDATLDYLGKMNRLRELDLNDTQVSDAGLAKLADLKSLEFLKLRATNISDEGFRQHIMPLPNLKRLDLRQTKIAAESIETWKSQGEGRRVLK